MENNQEIILVKSSFSSASCFKAALIWYFLIFIYVWATFFLLEFGVGFSFLISFLFSFFMGGLTHLILYFLAKNNKVNLTNYKITGTYSRHLSLNIPIDSISSVSKGMFSSLCITCAGNKYNISYVRNRDNLCSKLNELLNKRTQQSFKDAPITMQQPSTFDEIAKLKKLLDNGIISHDEFEIKKKQLLDL